MTSTSIPARFPATTAMHETVHPWNARFEGLQRAVMAAAAWVSRALLDSSLDAQAGALRERAAAFEASQPSYAADLRAAADAAQRRATLPR